MKHLLLFIIIILELCGPEAHLKKAEDLSKKNKFTEAISVYKRVTTKFPEYAPEALYKIGYIYQKKLKIYSESARIYEEILSKYPNTIWAEKAELGLFNSPNYFPLSDGNSWTEGDPQTGGRNMRIITNCREISPGMFELTKTYYAGERKVRSIRSFYAKRGLQLRAYSEPDAKEFTTLLKYPFKVGNSWETVQDGLPKVFTIVDTNSTVERRGKRWENCLKLKIFVKGQHHVFKYEYYAPGVGKVLTTTASLTSPESPVSELLSYSIKDE